MSGGAQQKVDVAILGGGFAGVYCAKTLVRRLGRSSGRRVALISEENYMVFQPMLPEVVGGSISPRHVVNPLRLLCRGAEVFKGKVESIDLPQRRLILNAGAFSYNVEVEFEHLVLTLGAQIDVSRIPGMSEHAYLMQNVGDAMLLRSTLISRLEEACLETRQEQRRRLLTFVVVGGGYSGVETAGQIVDLLSSVGEFYPSLRKEDVQVILIHSREHLLPTLSRSLGEYAQRKLSERGLKLMLNRRVHAVTASHVTLDDKTKIETNTVICTVGNAPHALVSQLCSDNQLGGEKGRIAVEATCQVPGHPTLWAAGDCAMVPFPGGGHCPDTAQFALRQGKLLGTNVANSYAKRPLATLTFKGQGELASIGRHMAVADVFGLKFSGFIAWWLWRTIYVAKLPRFDRKVRVVLDWTLDLFFPRDINQLSPRYSSLLQQVHLETGDYILHQGEPAFSLYIVKKGRIAITDATGIVRVVAAGEYFGERALLDDQIWHFDGRALEPSTLVSIPADVFHQIVDGAGSLGRLFTKSAGRYYSREIIQSMTGRLCPQAQSLLARDIMHREAVVLRPEMPLREVLNIAREHPHSSYPVVGSDGILGVVHREDFYEYLKRPESNGELQVKDLRLSTLPVVSETSTVPEIVEQLVRSGENKVLVEQPDHRLAGILTVMDLLSLTESCESKAVEHVN